MCKLIYILLLFNLCIYPTIAEAKQPQIQLTDTSKVFKVSINDDRDAGLMDFHPLGDDTINCITYSHYNSYEIYLSSNRLRRDYNLEKLILSRGILKDSANKLFMIDTITNKISELKTKKKYIHKFHNLLPILENKDFLSNGCIYNYSMNKAQAAIPLINFQLSDKKKQIYSCAILYLFQVRFYKNNNYSISLYNRVISKGKWEKLNEEYILTEEKTMYKYIAKISGINEIHFTSPFPFYTVKQK